SVLVFHGDAALVRFVGVSPGLVDVVRQTGSRTVQDAGLEVDGTSHDDGGVERRYVYAVAGLEEDVVPVVRVLERAVQVRRHHSAAADDVHPRRIRLRREAT